MVSNAGISNRELSIEEFIDRLYGEGTYEKMLPYQKRLLRHCKNTIYDLLSKDSKVDRDKKIKEILSKPPRRNGKFIDMIIFDEIRMNHE